MTLLTIKGLEKRYPGKQALCGVDMQIESGRIIGLLGPNTSGKTTLLKTIAGLLTPDRGEIVYPGGVTGGAGARGTVSMLPDRMAFPSWMRVRDALRHHEDMYPDYSRDKADAMLELLELPRDSLIKRLSKGMQERVALALAFSRKTALYLLDEPLGGIDPVGKMKVLESILSMPLTESSILLSTHLVKDVETIFDSVLFISQGKIIYGGECEEIRGQEGKTVEQKYLEVFYHAQSI